MKNYFILFALSVWMTGLSTNAHGREIPDFFWMKKVGAMSYPVQQAVYNVTDYGAKGDALSMNTMAIQKAIDAAEQAGGGIVVFHPGIYLTGSLFVGNNVNLHISKGVTLIGSQDIGDYKKIDTRVAGIEMEWPSALINIIGKKNAAISGDGVINGRGKVFWDKYWNMREDYEAKGLRWIVDYDCERPRGILIAECENVTVRDIVLYQPGCNFIMILRNARQPFYLPGNSCYFRVAFQKRHLRTHPGRQAFVIVVHYHNIFSACQRCRPVAGKSNSPVTVIAIIANTRVITAGDNFVGVVR